ncbi:NAD(P)H-hydrate dehydratase [Rhodohalobacter sp. 8-1]|uniref:NAD(P)H-hydrate dehydratase n=1 Tax=Rhodohalobacter sp. 8-1 TaxID=3131972 RepID=UPI0030EBCD48
MSLNKPDNRFLRLATRDQSRQLDEHTISDFGIDSITLMEIAGEKAAGVIQSQTEAGSSGIFVCGKGNNAGDALVVARYLTDRSGHSVTILMAAGDDDLSTDAHRNYKLLKKLAAHGSPLTILTDMDSIPWRDFDYAVDGMIGTGLTSDLREPMAGLADSLNKANIHTFAMDIPTGLNCDTGEILGTCVEADHTITFGTNKIGFYLSDGPSVTGTITLADLPFPGYLREHKAVLLTKDVREEFEAYSAIASHKYETGTVHIVAGSEGMTGAAMMAAKSAWNAGAGAVILYAPKALLPIYEQSLPQIIKVAVGDKNDGCFTPKSTDKVLSRIKDKPGVVLIGPGLGLKEGTQTSVLKLLKSIDQPVILDADGLSVWDQSKDLDKSRWIVTPHPGELKKHFDVNQSNDFERLKAVEKISRDSGCRVLSKGHPTMLATPDSGLFITGYNTKLFSRAGFGDVLAGTIAGKLAVSRMTDQSITDALISNYSDIEHIHEPEPSDIYDR